VRGGQDEIGREQMPASLNDYLDSYKQACTAYAQQKYDVAARLVDEVVRNVPDDPNCHLLRGHIYYVLEQYDVAKQEYQKVLELSDDEEIIGFAHKGLESINQSQEPQDSQIAIATSEKHQPQSNNLPEDSPFLDSDTAELEDLGVFANLDSENFEFNTLDEVQQLVDFEDLPLSDPFEISANSASFEANLEETAPLSADPFAFNDNQNSKESQAHSRNEAEIELPAFWQEEDLVAQRVDRSEITDDAPDASGFWQEDVVSESPETPVFWEEDMVDQRIDPPEITNDTPAFWQEDVVSENLQTPEINQDFSNNPTDDSEDISLVYDDQVNEQDFTSTNFSPSHSLENTTQSLISQPEEENWGAEINNQAAENLLIREDDFQQETLQTSDLDNNFQSNVADFEANNWLEEVVQEKIAEPSSNLNGKYAVQDQEMLSDAELNIKNFESDDFDDFEAFKSAFGSDEDTSALLRNESSQSNIDFLDDFDEFDDLENIPGFDLEDADSSFGDVTILSGSLDSQSIQTKDSDSISKNKSHKSEAPRSSSVSPETNRDDELFSITGSHNGVPEAVPMFSEAEVSPLEPTVNVEQGWLAPLENASLDVKPWFLGGTVGVFSALVVAIVSFGATNVSPPEQRESVRNTGWAMSLAAGLAGFGTATFMGGLTLKQIRRTTKDLQTQFDAVRQGNLNVQAKVYSEDELGRLATGFNEMARVIFTTTSEAQRKAEEQEEAKENLQRQVIRLLDDVEGAARGDLTVQAEVTADVLGAVADAFNLTIQNLRDIVQQVKVAAKEVTKGATNSETFARALSSDALRQAEELAVTLNSVQVMTESIQRVAVAAREAEIVAGDASAIALKGGEAVENTVAGILEIRETVAETTRKVKRLAESSQEISKIVALISQIASRTNLLALNASIEAARAGEAGRGFAIVADEVRQLADKSAKSLKEIEQIVMQIQSETGSVMTAMEEGTQQVIKGTKLAEEAKRSLENIIQVANRIDTLVRSITSDTVEQTETSRAVAHVMQSVELTAQETSQEAQRVSGALQLLVGVSGDLISSVERFRVETMDSR
jgi:twitching motility protein PilJ